MVTGIDSFKEWFKGSENQYHEHCSTDRLVEEQLFHQGGHCSGCRV